MLIGIKGGLGGGKTSVLSFIGLRQYAAGFNVYSNYKLNFPEGAGKVLPFKPEDLANGNWGSDGKPGILLLDELQVWMESRISTSEFNRMGTQMVLQTRKKNTHIAFTTQFFDQVDLRIRRLIDVAIECQKKKDYSHLTIMRTYDGRITEKKLYLPPLYGLFDTNEIIQPMKKFGESTKKVAVPEPVKKGNVNVPI